MSRRTLTLLLSSVLAAGLLLGALVGQVPYVALGPGPTFNTLGVSDDKPVIDVQGREVFPADGHLDLTTVGVRSSLSLGEALVGWLRRDEAVVPRELVFPPDQSDEEVDAENAREMTQSQDAATTAALGQLGIPVSVVVGEVQPGSPAAGALRTGDVLTRVDDVPVTSPGQLRTLVSDRAVGTPVSLGYRRDGADASATLTTAASPDDPPRSVVGVATTVTYPFTVTIALKDVGGPSAGLMFALGIVDKLEPGSLTGGAYIAGTGEITPEGVVRPIGGIQQKLRGAREKGATVFLVPAENCPDAAASRPDGLGLAKVSTLDEAVRALEVLRGGGTPAAC
ncbi:MAG TPA: PDZ domain-containing protein [Mycobacteriales bacterium]|nr:PDZ domain-containing protein [Mycobacteriales bacterium]